MEGGGVLLNTNTCILGLWSISMRIIFLAELHFTLSSPCNLPKYAVHCKVFFRSINNIVLVDLLVNHKKNYLFYFALIVSQPCLHNEILYKYWLSWGQHWLYIDHISPSDNILPNGKLRAIHCPVQYWPLNTFWMN